ncbi:sulfite reductase subunit C [Thermoanaerobacterium thermosaccharolyticum]|uniref:Sulfite reductase, subunit C n=2 Tax=Thermoanaerobacterium thermosaccharolyticum TaxID=1517 RepID=D9TNZ6_THETC|nr:sulfite reductase subunit C [Thermoanaerobacterium thermosaccharolyticum]ADL67734.1 sulfite reductase, subunit C [Thermoanaerobacterium thermosaccharolyticum DSM 571]MCP2240497.1 anaerobic sulfite reductase subunit C [Thermoanaerobacterium thermosaccharolyticum]OXT07356.1 sulfite reductase subunit C [Thermoanaerobacterium thermosaccharolyticum]
MILDIDTKLLKKNAYRVTKQRGITALRIRVPGGDLNIKYFDIIKEVAEKYGNGTVHITTRQGFEIPGISMEKIDEINELISPIIRGLKDEGVQIEDEEGGYPAAGTRNVSACIGNRVCPFANYDTTALALKIEKLIYPNDYHVKIAVTGCPNDCIKAHMQDIGIIGQVEPIYDPSRCIGCQACVKNCKRRVTGALTFENFKVVRDPNRCIGCGECILKCPTSAWTRGEKYYRIVIMGRTGKKNPRLAQTFIEWADEESVLKIIKNMYDFIDKYIDKTLDKEHVGYIVDREGFKKFKEEVLKDVKLPKKAKVANHIDYTGYRYERNTIYD